MNQLTLLSLMCGACALAQTHSFVYTNNNEYSGPKSVSAFIVSSNGSLAPVSGTPFLAGVLGKTSGLPRTITTTSTNKPLLYVIYSEEIAGFSIDVATGVLTPVPGSPFPNFLPGANDGTLAATPDDKYLIVSRINQIAVYTIATDGALILAPGGTYGLSGGGEILALKVTADGKFLAVGQVYPSRISMFAISALGELQLVPGSPFSAPVFPYYLEINCASDLLFTGEGFGNIVPTRVAVFDISPNGVLTPVKGSPFSGTGSDSVSVLLHPDDGTLFVANLSGSTISTYRVAPDGVLTSIVGSPFLEPGNCVGLGTDVAGKFLYAACQNGAVGAFTIASDRSLTPVEGQPYTARGNPPSDLLSLTVFPPKSCAAVDYTKPVSDVSPLPTFETSAEFTVQWFGTDTGSGIRDYTIFVSDNSGPFTTWLTDTTLTSATFTGQLGHTYGFYSIARDNAGNLEDPKTVLEATTRIDSTPPIVLPQISGTLGNFRWYRSDVLVSWTVTDPESGIVSSSGCNTSTLTTDTPGVTLTCSATNGASLSNSFSVTIKIDKTPPIISGMPPANCVLWPPNHLMMQVATVTSGDETSGLVLGSFSVTGSSNQPSDPKAPDVLILPNGAGGFSVQLRADRLGKAEDRLYTLQATANDLAGNMVNIHATCVVPHDQR